MKKYITIAALLAAGSAFANAAELTKDNAAGYLSLVDGVLTTSSDKITYADNVLSITDGYWAVLDGSRSISTIAMTFDASKLSAGSAALPLVELDGNAADLGLGLSTTGAFTGTWVYGSTINYSYFTSGYTVPESGNITVVLSLGNSGTRIWKDAGSGVWSNTGLKAKLSNDGNVSTIKLSETAASALNNIVVWNTDSYNDTTAVAGAINTSVSLIPEPSAFGLLAGLGALALVGARRRRR